MAGSCRLSSQFRDCPQRAEPVLVLLPRFFNMSLRYDQPGINYDAGWRYDSVVTRQRNQSMIKPKLELQKQSDIQFLESATAIKNAMTTNAAQYPNSGGTVTSLGAALTTFAASQQAFADAKVALLALKDDRDEHRRTVESLLRDCAGQVNEAAKGDVELIHDAGMQASNDPSPVPMTQVLNLRLKPSDHEGELFALWNRVSGTRVYQVQIAIENGTLPLVWQDKTTSTKARCSLNDTLVSGQKVWSRVRAVGARGEGAWSDPAVKTVP